MFNFVFDRRNDSRPYPNLAPMMDNPHESYHGLGDTYPFIIPVRLYHYCKDHKFPMSISYIDEPLPHNALYPIGIGWFDFSQDYFAMMPKETRNFVREGQLTVLFYYHEGDNPYREKERLDQLCHLHNLPLLCYRFISGNTEADKITGFAHFADHELFYWQSSVVHNKRFMPGCSFHTRIRNYEFTALSRVHKWWRGTIMTYLRDNNFLNKSRWSYNIVSIDDLPSNNPIRLSEFPGLKEQLDIFVRYAPYACDAMSAEEHNSHWNLVPEHYEDAYCNLVLETLYDAEQSNGAFITEKTFKPIRHAQPFIIFGTPNSLATLKKLGYRTFDNFLDNSYDSITNNTDRFKQTIKIIEQLSSSNLHTWYLSCKEDILHNQELFLSSKYNRLEELYNKLITNEQ